MNYSIGIDVGGTNIRAAICRDGEIVKVIKQRTNKVSEPSQLIDQIEMMVKELKIEDYDVKGIGIGVPGPVSQKTGYVHFLTNLGLGGFPLKQMLEDRLKMRVEVGNDAKMAALAESLCGAGKGYHIMQYVTLSTGIGGGLVIDGKLFYSTNGFSQEIGNMNLVPNGEKQGEAMNAGCFEAECSGTALVKKARLAGLDVKHAGEVFKLAHQGDKKALDIKSIWLENAGKALANLCAILEPDIFVLGGGMIMSAQYYFDELVESFNKYVFPVMKNKTKFALAHFDQDAGIIGASFLVL